MSFPEGFIRTFELLGRFLKQFPSGEADAHDDLAELNAAHYERFAAMVENEHIYNPWFTPEFVRLALDGIASMLEKDVLEKWEVSIGTSDQKPERQYTIGLVLAGNIPLVGFHDLLCVLASGNRALARSSSKDERLTRAVCEIIEAIDPGLGGRIELSDEAIRGMDAVIATGSNNSARYFEYYFKKYPHIIRKNRNGVAVLTGRESEDELMGLGHDIFSYFGLGCRNVSKIYVPEDYDLTVFMGIMDRFIHYGQHNKYANNVDYQRSIYLMNLQDFLDNGVLLLKEDKALSSPVGVVFYERYTELEGLSSILEKRKDEIQCIVSHSGELKGAIAPGGSQCPMPWDYADGVDTMHFLINELAR